MCLFVSLYCRPEDGLLYFVLFKSSQLIQAYSVAKEIVVCVSMYVCVVTAVCVYVCIYTFSNYLSLLFRMVMYLALPSLKMFK